MKLLRFFLLLFVFFALAGCNLVNVIKMRFANDDLVPLWPQQTSKVVMEAFYHEVEQPHIEVSINGISGFRFLVDTGASMSYVIDTEKAKELNLEKGFALSMGGWGDEEDSQLYQTYVDSLSLAGVDFREVSMAYLQASKTRYFARPDQATFDGVLGHDILRHFSWTFDRTANKITISRQAYIATGEENAIPFEVVMSKIAIPAEADFGDGQVTTQEFLIDTGSRNYAKVSAAYVDNNLNLARPTVTAADFGLSGKAEHRRTTIPQLTLGKQSFSNVKINMIGPDDDEDENWVIGSALLNHHVSVIDYPSHVMYLLPNEEVKFRSRYNLAGLELRKINDGRFVLRYVMPDMAAADLDFAEGDLIYNINGRVAHEISLVEWMTISSKPGKLVICRTREHDKCLSVHTQHLPGYSTQSVAD